MPRYSRSRSKTPARQRRRRRSYSNSSSSKSRTRSRSPLRGSRKYNRKASRGRSRSRTPPRKDQGQRGYKSASSKQRSRRSRSYTPDKRRYKGKAKSGSRSPHRSESYWSPKRSPQQSGQKDSQIPEGPTLPPSLGTYRQDYGKRVETPDQQGSSQSKYASGQSHSAGRSYRENEKTNYEAVSPDELRSSPKSHGYNESPNDRKISKIKMDSQPPQYYQVQERYIQGQRDIVGQNYVPPSTVEQQKAAPSQIIRPIFDPFSVKIPRRKDEGLKAIFDRLEFKPNFAPGQSHLEEPMTDKKEPMVYRQDIQFTGTLPVGGFPPQPHGFVERREPLILGPLEPSLLYPPRDGSVPSSGLYLGQPPTYHVQPSDQFAPVRDVQQVGDYTRQNLFVPEVPPILGPPLITQNPVSYQYPTNNVPDIKGPHDLRYDLESRRKQLERHRGSRSRSKSRSKSRSHRGSSLSRQRNVSRSRSRSPQYKSYQRRDSREQQKGKNRRPVRERLGNVSQDFSDSSFSGDDDDDNGKSYKWTQRNTRVSHKQHRQSTSRDRNSPERTPNKQRGTPTQRGGFRGWNRGRGSQARGSQARGRGYLGKNFIPGYNRGGTRGKFTQPNRRGLSMSGSRRSPVSTWTHDLFDKHKDKGDNDGDGKKGKKKAKGQEKDKKPVKQKNKTAKKGKKTKKSPSRGEPNQKTKSEPQAAMQLDMAS